MKKIIDSYNKQKQKPPKPDKQEELELPELYNRKENYAVHHTDHAYRETEDILKEMDQMRPPSDLKNQFKFNQDDARPQSSSS